ncbi:hypothetical protein BT69DRAFT_1348486 [Atractiella rhizophila]|nr:hypothetical protein BT69DRAFT_1348486 [Atractiella rhizophila]
MAEITSLEPSSSQAPLSSDYHISSPPRARPPSLPSIHDHDDLDERAPLLSQKSQVVKKPAPLFLRLTFLLVSFFFVIDLLFYILAVVSSFNVWISTLLNSTVVFRHHGSTALPVWLSLSSVVICLFSFSPLLSPSTLRHIAVPTRLVLSFTTAASLLIVVFLFANQVLRHTESGLTICACILSALSSAVGLIALYAGEKMKLKVERGEEAPLDREIDEEGVGCCNAVLEGLSLFFSLLANLLILLLIFFLFFLLLSSTIIRMVDSSQQVPGQRWTVDPFAKSTPKDDSRGVWLREGRGFQFHLNCRAVPGVSSTTNRTVLVDVPFGYPGRAVGDWVFEGVSEIASRPKIGRRKVELRVCYFDRPGYGWSDNSPSSSISTISRALAQSLAQAGEFSRLQSPNTTSGLILMSALTSSPHLLHFASLHSSLVSSHLLIDGFTPSLYFSPSLPLLSGWGTFFHQGVWRLFLKTGTGWGRWKSVIKGEGSKARIYAPSPRTISDNVARSRMQEEWERKSGSEESVDLTSYPRAVPHVVLTTKGLEGEQEWFVNDLVAERENVRWETVEWVPRSRDAKDGLGMCADLKVGRKKCLDALEELMYI